MVSTDLQVEMLKAIREGDRGKGERIRAQMQEQAARDFVRDVEAINRSFYRAWQDWDALRECQERQSKSRADK